MSMPIPTLSSPTFKFPSPSRLRLRIRNQTISFRPQQLKNQTFIPKFTQQIFGVLHFRKLGFCLNAAGNGDYNVEADDDAERLARGDSTMPDRFRYLTKEAPDPPIRWPWFVALGFLLYAWRAVFYELGNWKKAALPVFSFVGYLLKLVLAVIFHFIGDPITSSIRSMETLIFTVRSYYSWIIAYAPIPELSAIIVFASIVLAIGEAAVPNSISSQPYILTVAGLIGYAAVANYISEPGFWTLLLGLYGFSRLFKKRDDVTSALPAAAVLAAIGEPWIRVLVIFSYLALAITHYSKKLSEGKEEVEAVTTSQRVPVPLLCAGLAIGIRLAANWAGYRHLTWMIV
ncbi:embryo defective 1923 [Euphorbia peplus]|nr:embryo defective 1923 [Euphorbia peplus]